MQQDVSPQEVPVELTFGSILAEAREAKGYSIEDIVASLKLRPRQIHALESGQLDQLSGGTTYIRGMIRNYAKLLDLEPEPLLAQIAAQETNDALDSKCFTPEKLKVIGHSTSSGSGSLLSWRPNRVLIFLAGTAVAIGLMMWAMPAGMVSQMGGFFSEQGTKVSHWWSSSRQEAQSEDLLVPEATEMAAGATDASESVPAEFIASMPALAEEKIPDAEKNHLMGRAVSSTMPATHGALKMSFSEDAWLEIKEQRSRKTIFAGLVTAGSEQNFSGGLPLELKVGNAQAVILSFNGTNVNLASYTRQGVARLLLQ